MSGNRVSPELLKYFLRWSPILIITILVFFTTVILADSFPQDKIAFEVTQLNQSKYEEEYKTFEKQLELEDHQKSRRKRYIYLNLWSNLDVGFLVVIPITVVIPSMSNLFNKWRRRRSISTNINTLEDDEEQFEDDPLVQPHLDKISTYFELIDIPEHHCQLRAICEFSADPSAFYPISEMILGRLRNSAIPQHLLYQQFMANTSSNQTSTSLFRKFNTASEDGLMRGPSGCQERYSSHCKYPMDKLLSMNSLRIWKGIRNHFGFSFKEDFHF